MKVKLQFDKRSIQDFLILNVEKIVAGMVVLGTLMILYLSIRWYGNEKFSFDRTPESLQSTAERAKATIEQTQPKTLDVTNFVALAEHSRIPVVEQPYVYPNLWDRPLFELPALRAEPPLLAARQLRGTAEFGSFHVTIVSAPAGRPPRGSRPPREGPAAVAAAPTDTTRGKQFVVLTALVPFAEQETAYIDTFSPSAAVFKDPTTDTPQYWGYWVQRVEVTSPADAANPPWNKAVKISLKEARDAAWTEWNGPQAGSFVSGPGATELVALEYIDPELTFPLGPLTNRRWTASVAHEPEIPVNRGIMDFGDREGVPADMPIPGDRIRGGPGRTGTILDASPFAPDVKPALPDHATPDRPPVDVPRTTPNKSPFKLLRFFDFTVEPGKQYIYRVQLVLHNPNRLLSKSILMDPACADKVALETNWSDPSPVIVVPLDWHIFLLAVNPPQRAGTEPSGQIELTKWKPEKGAEYGKDFSISRGQVANFLGASAKPLQAPLVPSNVGLDDSPPMDTDGPPTAAPRRTPTAQVDFITDVTALDFRGGERFRKRGNNLTSPGEILLMNPDGSLLIRNELDDITAWDNYSNPSTPSRPRTDPAAGPPARTALDAPRR